MIPVFLPRCPPSYKIRNHASSYRMHILHAAGCIQLRPCLCLEVAFTGVVLDINAANAATVFRNWSRTSSDLGGPVEKFQLLAFVY